MESKGTVLYIGGFELPDKNAAAQRVVGIAKGLREIGYKVVFLNSLKGRDNIGINKKKYFGFQCYEYGREKEFDYLFSGKITKKFISKLNPDIVVAYNYPGFSLEKIRRHCNKKGIKCYADVTEWYQANCGNIIYRLVKNLDSFYRMKIVQKRLDGVITISRFLFDYYSRAVKTVLVPPTVDITDKKWEKEKLDNSKKTIFVYAGSPSSQKEKIDYVVQSFRDMQGDNKIIKIVGIDENQFREIYNWKKTIPSSVKFMDRVNHEEAIKIVKDSDWAIIFRENNKVVKAGFPTKVVEAVTCGTAVIANPFSNILDYLDNTNSLIVNDESKLKDAIKKACKDKKSFDNTIFDYRNFLDEIKELFH